MTAPQPAPARTRRGVAPLLAAGVFVVVLAAHVASPVRTVIDSRWSLLTALSLLREGDTDLDEYGGLLARAGDDYRLLRHDGHVYDRYPLLASLCAVPLLAVLDAGLDRRLGFDLEAELRQLHVHTLEEAVASTLVALSAAVMVLAALRLGLRPWQAVTLALTLAFATSAWSTASRALWQHAPSMLCLTLTLYALVRARTEPRWVAWMALPLAVSYVARPTNAIPIAVLTGWVLLRRRRQAPWFFGLALLVAVPFVAYSAAVYQRLLPPYYTSQVFPGDPLGLLEGLAGTLASPARGLLIYSPVLLFAVTGARLALRDAALREVARPLAAILVLHWLVVSAYHEWHGGWGYGPRYFTDVTPLLVLFLAPVLSPLARRPRTWRGVAARALFVALLSVSVWMHVRGAASIAVHRWNQSPVDLNDAPERVWDWSDPPFLR